jgi:hypothetical protein
MQFFWQICARENILISISKYPIKIDLAKIGEKAEQFGAKVQYEFDEENRDSAFMKHIFDLSGSQDANYSHSNCWQRGCHEIKDGRLYKCPVIPNSKVFFDHFGLTAPPQDAQNYIEIDKANTSEIAKYMKNSVPFCKYCNIKRSLQLGKEKFAISKRELSEFVES